MTAMITLKEKIGYGLAIWLRPCSGNCSGPI